MMRESIIILLLLCLPLIFGEEFFFSNQTQHLINELEYSHEIIIRNHDAEFTFTLSNISHARHVLGINSYYLSITFIDREHYDQQLSIMTIESNTTEYHGRLEMMHLEEEGNYLVCVFFLNQSFVISSSRFCHVVSVAGTCNLEIPEEVFNNRQAIILVATAAVLLIFVVVVSCIKSFISRPRTIKDHMKNFTQTHNENLEALANVGDGRRRRQPQQILSKRLREDSVQTIENQENIDGEFYNYHGTDNASFSTLPEDEPPASLPEHN